MTEKRKKIGQIPIIQERVRTIGKQGFSFIPNRFLREGFFVSLKADELLLYFFLVLASDRIGMSFYYYDSICSILKISLERYIAARNALIDKDLLAFDGTRFQVLSLPEQPLSMCRPLKTQSDFEENDGATISLLIKSSLVNEQ